MDFPDTKNENGSGSPLELLQPQRTKTAAKGDIFDPNSWKEFYHLTGGSLLYCLSAVFVACGIVKVMGPILSGSDTIKDALICIFTLHIYEISLLGVLILIVSKKIVDDAVSLVVLIALFLVGTSIALGSAADKGITASLFVGLFGIAIAFGKFYSMKRFIRIPFRTLSILGLMVLMACNYLGPAIMARLVSTSPSQDLAHRELWMFIWVIMLIAGSIVLIEAMREKEQQAGQTNRVFLQSPVMVYVFSTILLVASGVHQYSMSYMFALERVFGDYVPLIALVTLIALEIFRHLGRRFKYIDILISFVPLAAMLLAISEKTVVASDRLGFGLVCYPPVFFALSGAAIAAVAIYHRWYRLFVSVFLYGLGIILTVGFSPQHPHDLNIHACFFTLVVSLIIYGIIIRNQFSYLAGIAVLCIGLAQSDSFSVFVKNLNLTEPGTIAGVFGIGCIIFYLLFGQKLHKAFQVVGALCLAVFIYDLLPEYIHWLYIIVLPATGCLIGLLWFIRKNILVMAILFAPFLVKLYVMAKYLAYWRLVILGFVLLAAGAVASLFKRPSGKSDQPAPPAENQ